MEEVTVIVAALIAGAGAASQGIGGQLGHDAVAGLTLLVKQKLAGSALGQAAVDDVTGTTKPDSPTANVIKDKLEAARAGEDGALIARAKALLELIQRYGPDQGTPYTASISGGGASAQGDGARAVGQGGVWVGGNNSGSINTGTQAGTQTGGSTPRGQGVGQQGTRHIDTGGGAYVEGDLTTSGDFVGRDRVTNYASAQPSGSANTDAAVSDAAHTLAAFLNNHFSEEELRDVAFQLNVDWDNVAGATKQSKARELAIFCDRRGRLPQLKGIARLLRPILRDQLS